MGRAREGRDAPTDGIGRLEERVVLTAVVVVGAVLRWHWLGQPIRYDEAVTWLEYASRPLAEGLSLYDLPNNHLFHTFLAHLATDALGSGVRALRLPAFLAGVLTVPATWALGRRLYGRAAGLLSAAAVAISPVLVLFSTNARGYSLVVLAFVVLALLASELRRRSSVLLWSGFAATAALAGWTMPAALYPAVGVGLWILWPPRRDEPARPLASRAGGLGLAAAGAAAATAILYLPVVRRSGWRSVVANRFVAPSPLDEFIAEVPVFLLSVPREWAHGVPGWISVFVLLGAVAAAVREGSRRIGAAGPAALGSTDASGGSRADRDRRPTSDAGSPPLLPAALLGAVLVLAVTRRTPFARVWLFLLPAFVVFAAGGLRDLARRTAVPGASDAGSTLRRAGEAAAGVALVLLVGGGVHLLRADPVTSWGLTGSLPAGHRVAALLDRRMGPGDAVRAPLPSDAPLEYYFSLLGRDPGLVNDVPAAGACLWIVENRRHDTEGLAGLGPDPEVGAASLVRDFGASAVYVLPETAASRVAEEPEGPAAVGRADEHRCRPGGGDRAGAGTDSPRRPPAHGGEEAAER